MTRTHARSPRAVRATVVLAVALLVAATTSGGAVGAQKQEAAAVRTSTTPSTDEPSTDEPSTIEPSTIDDTGIPSHAELVRQEELDSHVDPLTESGLLDRSEGYGGFAIDYDDHAVDLWWRGDVPDDVRTALADFGDVAVRIHPARYTQRQVDDACYALLHHHWDRFTVSNAVIASLDRPTSVYGTQVHVTKLGDISDAEVVAELTQVAGLPVSLGAGEDTPAVGRLPYGNYSAQSG